MKKLITTNISGATKAPFTKPALDNLQGNFSEIPASIIKALLGTYTTNDVIILEGFVITLSNSNNTATWTTGSVYYNGEVYQVASGTLTKSSGVFLYSIVDSITNATFSDGTNNPWIEIRTITITSGTSGTGIADYGATSVHTLINKLTGVDSPVLIPYLNSFTRGTAGAPISLYYRIDIFGNVFVTGTVKAPATITSSIFASMPIDARPKTGATFLMIYFDGSSNNIGQVDIQFTGEMDVFTSAGTTIAVNSTFFIQFSYNINN